MRESRLFKIVYYLLEKGRATAPELAEKFEVSVRTIYRDIDVLSSTGIPVYVTTGRNGGIHILDHYVLDRSLFSAREKQDILAALQSVSVVNGTVEEEIMTKLSALFHVRSDNWYEVDFTRWGVGAQDNTTFELLKNAVILHRALSIVYVNSRGVKNERKIYPLKMMYKAKEWYLKAYCTEKSGFRIFKCSRIIGLRLLAEEFTPMEYPTEEDMPQTAYPKITFRFPREMAYRVYDEFEADKIVEEENGDFTVSAEMPVDDWLIGYLLSFGAQVEVLEPAYLKEKLAEQGKLIYEKNKP